MEAFGTFWNRGSNAPGLSNVLQAFALVGHRGSQVILEAGIPGIPKGVVSNCHKARGDGCDPAHFW